LLLLLPVEPEGPGLALGVNAAATLSANTASRAAADSSLEHSLMEVGECRKPGLHSAQAGPV
jgi:hypothetical protein